MIWPLDWFSLYVAMSIAGKNLWNSCGGWHCWSLTIAATANTIQGCHNFVKITNPEYSRYTDYFLGIPTPVAALVQCAMWSMHSAVCRVQFTLCSAHCEVCTAVRCSEECHSLSVGHSHAGSGDPGSWIPDFQGGIQCVLDTHCPTVLTVRNWLLVERILLLNIYYATRQDKQSKAGQGE